MSTRVPEELLETPSSCDLAPPCEPLDPDPVALDAYVFHPNLSDAWLKGRSGVLEGWALLVQRRKMVG